MGFYEIDPVPPINRGASLCGSVIWGIYPGAGGDKMKIIIADDSRVMRNIIDRTVTSLGYETIHAGNGQDVIEILQKEKEEIGLILLDWNMPELTGYQVLKTMQGNKYYRKIPVLMVSTDSEDDKTDMALDAGARGYLSKPFKSEDLIAKIQEVLSLE
jgi:two-component system, chemotaxis family, chemotaxis protein CheY